MEPLGGRRVGQEEPPGPHLASPRPGPTGPSLSACPAGGTEAVLELGRQASPALVRPPAGVPGHGAQTGLAQAFPVGGLPLAPSCCPGALVAALKGASDTPTSICCRAQVRR